MSILNKIKRVLKSQSKAYIDYFRFLNKNQQKIFCIGQNKTGTTSLMHALRDFGYKFGRQYKASLLIDDWYRRDFKKIVKYCKTADAFQDIPFSMAYTYQQMDIAFKNAKFILTERDDAEQWYKSITEFHAKRWGDGTNIPTKADLINEQFIYKGFAYDYINYTFHTPDDDLYNKQILIENYLNYNKTVKDYFRSRPDKLLVINVSKPNDYDKLCLFLNQPNIKKEFPWKNKTNAQD